MFLQNLRPSAKLCLLSIHDLTKQPTLCYTKGCFVFNWQLFDRHTDTSETPFLFCHGILTITLHHTHTLDSWTSSVFLKSCLHPFPCDWAAAERRGIWEAFYPDAVLLCQGSTHSCPYIPSKKKQINAK